MQTQRNNAFDNLRGIVVLFVVIYHFSVLMNLNIQYVSNLGLLGVKIFFLISGYLIFASFQKNVHQYGLFRGTREYFINRFFRIIPAYYFNLIVIILIVPFIITDYSFIFSVAFLKQIVVHMLFLAYLVYRDNGWGLNGSYWTLSIELLWYILIPILFVYLNTIKRIFLILILSILYLFLLENRKLDFLVGLIKPAGEFNINYEDLIIYLSYQLPGQLMFFSVGILLLKFNKKLNFNIPINKGLSFFLIAITIIGSVLLSNISVSSLTLKNLYLGIIAVLVFVILINISSNKSNILSWLGKISYSVYLWHYPILAIGKKIEIFRYVSPLQFACIFTVLLLVISGMSYYFIEKMGLSIKDSFRKWKQNRATVKAYSSFKGPNQSA
ncbi:acyltransferase family protein [Paenibacillus sp. y28]|uniref:acyltransferase family protein n=1 Tax=Paenibacillus sp. y28 TaxID=3129110 RepID=UPI003018C9B9